MIIKIRINRTLLSKFHLYQAKMQRNSKFAISQTIKNTMCNCMAYKTTTKMW